MNIIIVRNNGADAKNISLLSIVLLLIIIFLLMGWAYNYLMSGSSFLFSAEVSEHESILAIQTIHNEQKKIKYLEISIDSQIENFATKLAKLQSQLIQLDSVGEKLVKVAKLDRKEFNFDTIKAIGGPDREKESEGSDLLVIKSSTNIQLRLTEIQNELSKKSQQLYAIEALYDDKLYRDTVTPQGKPAEKGWISSYFGKRKDPFTGKKSKHRGIDVAGKANTHIIATASGIITWAKKKSGYGNLVEISHGNGLVTRYGHCKKILVKEGQIVEQGEKIATIGTTGRSTGPHVHYEVIKKGVKINPLSYVKKKNKENL
jgi:murein DD-endopeptidase MepM/ murein hydrolase activator NlpD